MRLEDGKTYLDGDGARVTIGGATRCNPEWCWSLAGYWYVRATGEALTYGKVGREWTHYVELRARLHIAAEAPPDAN